MPIKVSSDSNQLTSEELTFLQMASLSRSAYEKPVKKNFLFSFDKNM